jgi:hypothetical protein
MFDRVAATERAPRLATSCVTAVGIICVLSMASAEETNPPHGDATAPPLTAPSPAFDQPTRRPEPAASDKEPWLLSLDAYTAVPVDIGARVSVETPFRLRASAAYGIVPGAYLGLVNSAVESTGAYDALVADVISASFEDGTVLRATVGYRPIGGLYLDVGYAHVSLSGEFSASDIPPSASAVDIGATPFSEFGYTIDSTIHMGTAEVGYQLEPARHLLLAFGIGVMRAFDSESRVTANFASGRSAAATAVTDLAVAEYDERLEQYGIIPTLTVRAGYNFL